MGGAIPTGRGCEHPSDTDIPSADTTASETSRLILDSFRSRSNRALLPERSGNTIPRKRHELRLQRS